MKIYFDDKEVETISRVRLLFINSGTNDIRKSDLGGSSKVEVHMEGAEVLSVACIGGAAEESNAKLSTLSTDGAAFSFEYLNPGQGVVTELILAGEAVPKVRARIMGGRLRTRKREQDTARAFVNTLESASVMITFFVVAVAGHNAQGLSVILMIIVGAVVVTAFWLLRRLFQRRRQATYGLLDNI